MKTTAIRATSIHKVRRDVVGGKRGAGHYLQRKGRRIRRPDASRIRPGQSDPTLTGVAGLAEFGSFCRQVNLDSELKQRFGHMKTGVHVVYPMPEQVRLLLDAQLCGESRVLGLEALAADRLFVHLAGGTVPSIDTVYRDLCRFEHKTLASLEDLMVTQGFALLATSPKHIHIDIDTTVEEVFGHQQCALPGPNPRYRARPSYHPLLAVVAGWFASGVSAVPCGMDLGSGAMFMPHFRRRNAAVQPHWGTELRSAVGQVVVFNEVTESRVLPLELQRHRTRRSMALLGDDDLGLAVRELHVEFPLLVLGRTGLGLLVLQIVFLAIHEQHHVRVLLDRAGFAQVGQLRMLVVAIFDLA